MWIAFSGAGLDAGFRLAFPDGRRFPAALRR
jgi:hypothetical protein